jgi:hypothetical protein
MVAKAKGGEFYPAASFAANDGTQLFNVWLKKNFIKTNTKKRELNETIPVINIDPTFHTMKK